MQLWGTGGGEALFPGVALMKNNGEHQSCAVQPPPSPPPRASPLGTGGLWGRQAAFSVCSDPHQEPRVTLCWVMAVGQQGWVLVLPMGSVGPSAPYGVTWPHCSPGTRCVLGAAGGGPSVPGSMCFNRADCLRGFLLPSVAAKQMGMALLCGRRSAVGFNDGHRRRVGMEALLLSMPAQAGVQH